MTVFQQVLILYFFVVFGYILSRIGKVDSGHSKILSSLLVNVFLPCNALKTFSGRFTVAYLQKNYALVLISLAVLLTLAVAAFAASKLFSKNKYMQRVYEYSLVIPNMGYMGYPLVQSMYGMDGLMDLMMFGIPLNLYIYLYGYSVLTKSKGSWKAFCNPTVLAMVAGTIIGLSGISLPVAATDILTSASNCMGPVSMLLTGIVISEYQFKEILREPRVYVISALRLFVIPVAVGLVLSLFVTSNVIRIAVLLYALPCGLNTVVFPKLVNEDCKVGAGIALVSHVAACATIPLLFWLFGL